MYEFLDKIYLQEAASANSGESWLNEFVDVADGELVLQFTYRYLEARSLPPSDDVVRGVTAAIARYRGPQVASWAILELFLGGLPIASPA